MATAPPAQQNVKVGKGPGSYSPETSWSIWEERFDFYLTLRGINDAETQKLLLFSELGPIYQELRQLCQPEDVRTKTMDEIKALMRDRYGESKSLAAKRHELFSLKQQPGESIRDFAVNLRGLAAKAEWPGASVDLLLSSLFINGISNDGLRADLMKSDKTTFKDIVEVGSIIEQSSADARVIGHGPAANSYNKRPAEVAKLSQGRGGGKFGGGNRGKANSGYSNVSKPEVVGECYCCGKPGHYKKDCFHLNSKCNKCGESGHLATMCKKKSSGDVPAKSGKRRGGRSVNAIASVFQKKSIGLIGHEPPAKLDIRINGKMIGMEVDTGADVSLLAKADWTKVGMPTLSGKEQLLAYGGSPIDGILGTTLVRVQHKGQDLEAKFFVIDGRGKSLMGRDVIKALKVDLNSAFGIGTTIGEVKRTAEKDLKAVLEKYPDIFNEGLGNCKKLVSLKFKENVQPRKFKPRPVPFALKPEVEKGLENWVKEGVLESIECSEWATPLVIVPKPNGKLRLCADYKVTVNSQLDIHQYPLPRPDDLFNILNGGQKFSKLDLKEAYLQLRLDPKAQECLAICTHKGLFRFKRMPYGVASAPSIFQQTMEDVLQGIEGVAVYLDDILITGKDDKEHLERLEMVLKRISENGLRVKKEKCSFMEDRIEYLGHVVDKQGIHTSAEKVEAIRNMPAPKNLKELQSFLGMVNYYGKFVPALATVVEPLNELRRSAVKWFWGKAQQLAFERVKELLSSDGLLVHYDPDKPLFLAADASDYGMGAVLFHTVEGSGQLGVIAYASRTFSTSERNYAQIEKEGRAIIFGVEKFNQYLYGRRFVLQTDHEPLKRIFGPKGELPVVAARRLHRWALILMNYDFEIEYCRTSDFGNADGLSRLPCPQTAEIDSISLEVDEIQSEALNSLPVTVEDIARETAKDAVLKRVTACIQNGWANGHQDEAMRPYWLARNELEVKSGCILLGTRTVIPDKFRDQVLELVHATHPGIVRMKALARQKVWWPRIDRDIEGIKKKCKICQSNGPDECHVPLHPWETPKEVWQRLHIDFCGPFLGSMWLIVVDAKSKWPEIVKMGSTTAEQTIKVVRKLFFNHGIPQQIVSDNGPQFTSAEWAKFCQERGIVHTLTAPYHPMSNGEAERMVQSFKNAMKLLAEDGFPPEEAKDQFVLRYRVTPHAATGISPAELLCGRKFRTMLDLVTLIQEPGEGKEKDGGQYQERTKRNFDRKSREKSLEVGQKVFARNYRDGQKWIPGQVLKRIGSTMFTVRTDRGLWSRHLDQLKIDLTSHEDAESESDESEVHEEELPVNGEFEEADVPPVPPQPVNPQVGLRRSTRQPKPKVIFDPSNSR